MIQQGKVVDILIVGGGASAVAIVAALGRSGKSVSWLIAERSSAHGLGVAYSTELEHHILNVPAQAMGIDATAPDDFINWVGRRSLPYQGSDFVARRIYGEYLQEVLARELQNQRGRVWQSEVVKLERCDQGFRVSGSDGVVVLARQVVLASGHAALEFPIRRMRGEPDVRLVRNPWLLKGYEGLDGAECIGILGTGLTAMDVVGALDRRGYSGTIILMSRRGLLPFASRGEGREVEFSLPADVLEVPLRQLLRWIRQQIAILDQRGDDWRGVIDVFRPHSPALWRRFSDSERAQFLRHLRPYWEVVRHRMPATVRSRVEQLCREKRLHIVRGRAQEIDFQSSGRTGSLTLKTSSGFKEIKFDRLFNCTGSGSLRSENLPLLLASLRHQGLISLDRFGLGVLTAPNGAVIGANGAMVTGMYVVGPLRRASDWESTAMREVRQQAGQVAAAVLASIE